MSTPSDREPPPKAERRPATRKRTLLGGLIVHGDGRYSFSCIIRNLSADGARISFGPHEALPAEFVLINRRDGTGHKARRVWARTGEAGVQWDASFAMDAIPPELSWLSRFGRGMP